ncbi:hypothetical protein GOV14_05145 [Candidatus Pacearchaeota archaeon]|nr:hypothetical protein [Candidatus Pacearchaeota archaeon]
MTKIICLGNEFIKEDSLAKKIGETLGGVFDVFMINDSFQLMEVMQNSEDEKIFVLDVVSGLNEVKLLNINDLRQDSIFSAHDFDAGFVLKLLGNSDLVKILGIPIEGDMNKIRKSVEGLITSF